MKNTQKVSIIFASLAVVAAMFIACEMRSPEEIKKEAQAKQVAVQKEVIPLDETQGVAAVTRNFYFIFDGSGSMDGECDGRKKIDGAKEALKKFMENVPQDANLGLYSFNAAGEKEFVTLASNNRDAFQQAFASFEANNGTPLIGAIKIGTDKLVEQYKKQLGYGEYRLIIITDGAQTDGFAETLEQAVLRAVGFNFQIYTIGLCMSESHPLRALSLSYQAANNFQDLEKALKAAVAETEDFSPMEFPAAADSGKTN